MKFYSKRGGFLGLAIVGLLCFSCKDVPSSPSQSESELITKINAVQEQIMAQGNITEKEEQALLSLCNIVSHNDGLANYDSNDRMVLKDVEIAPVHSNCEALSTEEKLQCFNEEVSKYIKKEFNSNILKDLDLSEAKQVDAFFIIDKNGKVSGIKVREAVVNVQAEILRILRTMPEMKPAMHKGKPVSVLCSVIIKYGKDIQADVVYIPELPNDL